MKRKISVAQRLLFRRKNCTNVVITLGGNSSPANANARYALIQWHLLVVRSSPALRLLKSLNDVEPT
jgi:hypothetical protein